MYNYKFATTVYKKHELFLDVQRELIFTQIAHIGFQGAVQFFYFLFDWLGYKINIFIL